MASAWLQIWADVVYRKMDRSQIDRLSYFLETRNMVLLWYAKLVSRTQLLKLVKIMSEYKNLLKVVSLVVSLEAFTKICVPKTECQMSWDTFGQIAPPSKI